MKKILYIFIFFLIYSQGNVFSQQIVEIPPLFEYPVAPDELTTLEDKSNYLVAHFWDQLDAKNTNTVNQLALNDAFSVYLTTIRFASEKNALQSIDKLLSRIANNPTLLIQFANAAEENLYGPRAEIWADDIYLKFLDAPLKNKKISKNRKEKYSKRAELIRGTSTGKKAPEFDFGNTNGGTEHYFPMATPTLIIFGDPEDVDWRLQRLRMESNTDLNQALDKGKLNLIFIDVTDNENWQNAVSNYSSKWKVGKSKEIKDIYDIRIIPSIYVVDTVGNIALKNQPINEAVQQAIDLSGL